MVFPTPGKLLPYLIDNGLYEQAGATIAALLGKAPLDASVVDEAVRLDLLEGAPDRAIDRLETLHRRSPLSADRLTRLARLYEWRRKPAKALATWERLLEKAPRDETVLMRLIGYYRYSGATENEGGAILRLIRQQRAAGKWQVDGLRSTDLVAAELEALGRDQAGGSWPPLKALLISGLYQLYEQVPVQPAIDAAAGDAIADPLMIRCLEQFVWTGYLKQGEAFAAKADRLWHAGIDHQMRLVDALRWSQMQREALDLLQRLQQQVPQDRRVLMAMAETAAAAADATAGIAACQALVRLEPTEPQHRQRLLALYRQTGQTAALFDEYQRQFQASADPRLALELLNLAIASGASHLQDAALSLTARSSMDDPAVLAQQARLYLALSQPAKAYRVMRRLTPINGNRVADILETLEMAGHSGDPRLIEAAIAWAAPLATDDPAVCERTVALYLAIGRADRAYERKAEQIRRRQSAHQVPELVALAESTGRPELLADALRIGEELTPYDADLTLRLARFHLAEGKERQAIAAFERYLRLRPGDRSAQIQLARLHEWQHQPQKALAIYRQLAGSDLQDAAEAASISAALTRLMAATGDSDGLLQMAIQAADAAPRDADRALAAGRALVAASRLEAGQVYLERAATLAPARTAIWQELADVYEWTGQTDRLVVALKHLAEAGLLDRRQLILLADTYLSQQRGVEALALLQSVENAATLERREGLLLAEAYEQSDRPDEARRLYNRLFDENRKDPAFIADLGNRAMWRQHTDLALTFYEAVLQADPHNQGALKGSGQIYAWNDNQKRAIETLEIYNRLFPQDYETRYLLGEQYIAAHREADAQKQFRKAMKLINAGRTRRSAGPHSTEVQTQP